MARGFFAGAINDPASLVKGDIRRNLPRFQEPHFSANLSLLQQFADIASEAGCAPVQLALQWLLAQGEHVIPIPGTTSLTHLKENLAAASLNVDAVLLKKAGDLINQVTVSGNRYPPATQLEIDTEEFNALSD